jgi:hypothetical protein
MKITIAAIGEASVNGSSRVPHLRPRFDHDGGDMKITIESTPVIVEVDDGVAARRWEGVTEGGIPVIALVSRVSPQTHDPAVEAQFAAELRDAPPPAEATGFSPERVERLAKQLLYSVNAVLEPPSRHPDNVFVALNALAYAAAAVIAGTGDQRAQEFFERALAQNIVELAHFPEGPDAHLGSRR